MLNLAAVVLGLYLAYLALLYVTQRSVMFPGAGMRWEWNLRALPAASEQVSIEASFGQVRGLLLPAAIEQAGHPAPALLYFHGNAEFVDQNARLLQPLTELGLHVLLVEYPGYAGSDGRPNRDTLAESGIRGHDWLASQSQVDPERIVVMGRSIGSGAAVDLAGARPPAALVLLSPFASLAPFAHRMGAPAFLLGDRYDNRAGLTGFDRPLLLFHGHRDEIIPYSHSLDLAASFPQARLVSVDCGHNDCPYFDAGFMHELAEFLQQAGVLPGAGGREHEAGDADR